MQVSPNHKLLPKQHLLNTLKKNLYLASRLTAVIYNTYDCMVDDKVISPCAYLTPNSDIKFLLYICRGAHLKSKISMFICSLYTSVSKTPSLLFLTYLSTS